VFLLTENTNVLYLNMKFKLYSFCPVLSAVAVSHWLLSLHLLTVHVHIISPLRSAACGHLVAPRTRLQLGNWAFCVAGPVAWNSLPLDICSAPTLWTFKNLLKTHLFLRSHFT